jgi:hypothetical protein
MALQLSKELDTGVTGDYWRVVLVQLSPLGDRSTVIVCLYKDAAARAADKTPLETREYSWNAADYPFAVAALDEDNPYVIAYEKLKTLPEFVGAVDA